MNSIYVSYKCKNCKKEIILISDEVLDTLKRGYLACSHCSSKRLIVETKTDDLRECMKELMEA